MTPLRSCSIYIDRTVIVINKPPGVVCQLRNGKLRNANRFNKLISEVKWACQLPEEPWPVHRLDKDTTGALLLARGRPQAREFQVQFRERRVGKTYLALVQAGRDAFPDASGSIRNVLAYDLDGRFCTILPGKVNTSGGEDVSGMQWVGDIGKTVETITHWKLLGSSTEAPVSLVLNAPILLDPLYSRSHQLPSLPDIGIQRGLYLHASHVSFHSYRKSGPHKRFRVGVTAPLPPYFVQACQKLGIPLTSELIDGGVCMDDVRQDLSVLRKAEGAENGMRWLL